MRCLLASPMNSGNVAVLVYGWAYCVIWHVLRNFIKGICLCAWEERTLHRWCVIHGPSVTQDAPPWGGTAITYNHAQVCWLVKPLYIDLRSAGVCIAGGVSPLSICLLWLHNLCIWSIDKMLCFSLPSYKLAPAHYGTMIYWANVGRRTTPITYKEQNNNILSNKNGKWNSPILSTQTHIPIKCAKYRTIAFYLLIRPISLLFIPLLPSHIHVHVQPTFS